MKKERGRTKTYYSVALISVIPLGISPLAFAQLPENPIVAETAVAPIVNKPLIDTEQTPHPTEPPTLPSVTWQKSIGLDLQHSWRGQNHPAWNGVGVNASAFSSRGDIWVGDIVRMNRGDQAHDTWGRVYNEHKLTARDTLVWSAAGASSSEFVPRLAVGVGLKRQLFLNNKQWFGKVGYGFEDWSDGERVHALSLSGIYKFTKHLQIEIGGRKTSGHQGNSASSAGEGGHSYSIDISHSVYHSKNMTGSHEIELYFEKGNNLLDISGATASSDNQISEAWVATWKQWLADKGGVRVQLQHINDSYVSRNTILIGVFKDF